MQEQRVSVQRRRLQADVIVDRIPESLFATQVPFRRLHRNVPQQELNLLQFTASLMALAGASPSEVMRGQGRNLTCLRFLFHHAPDDLGAEACSPDPSRFIDRAKESASGDSRSPHPTVDSSFHPIRRRNGLYVAALADEIGNDPVLLPLLNVPNS